MVARPDPSTFQVLPWATAAGEHYSARMFCDIAMPDGSPSWADPRHVLRRALSKAGEAGFTCYVHPEIEFYLLRDLPSDGTAADPRRPGRLLRPVQPRRRPALPAQRDRDAGVDGHLGRVQPPRGRPRAAGDRPALRRRADDGRQHHDVPVRGQGGRDHAGGAARRSCPSRSPSTPGSAMHTHFSLFEGDRNAFHDPDDPYELSETGKAFVAGRAAARARRSPR